MGTATTSATLLSLVLAGWIGATVVSVAAPANRGPGPGQTPAQTPASPQGATGEAPERTGPTAARNAPQPAGREKRRRTSYASCNRESHRRSLRGGARRRFLIRCRLGYERRQQPTGQGAALGQGSAPGQGTGQGMGQGPAQPPARRP